MGAVAKRCRIHQGEYKKYAFGEKASFKFMNENVTIHSISAPVGEDVNCY